MKDTYTVVIPPQLGLSIDKIRLLLAREGYNIHYSLDSVNCEIRYCKLVTAQYTEMVLKPRFECYIVFNNHIDDNTIVIHCHAFNIRGTWMYEEDVYIPADTLPHDIPEQVRKYRKNPQYTYAGNHHNNVPFLIYGSL